MPQLIRVCNHTGEDGNPRGGYVAGPGLSVHWQDRPLRTAKGEPPAEPNGAFVESVLMAAKWRLEFFQQSKFACSENALAITHIDLAIEALGDRTKDREKRGVEGLNEI